MWRQVVSKVEGRASSVEGYCISKLPCCAMHIKDQMTGLNDPIGVVSGIFWDHLV
jgi:hypothetical protein